jgi:hypothetical protein
LSTNITGFTIQRRLGAGAWGAIAATVTNTGTSYSITDTSMTAAGSYSYRLLATSLGGNTPTAITAAVASNAIVTP